MNKHLGEIRMHERYAFSHVPGFRGKPASGFQPIHEG